MKLPVYNLAGKEVSTVEMEPKVFEIAMNNDLLKQTLLTQRTNARKPYAHTKTRAFVRGGGKKPWKQKGTGRARAGSNRSPIWIGGAVVFGPLSERNYSLMINKKQKKKAVCMVLSDRLKEKAIVIVDSLELADVKTKQVIGALKNLKIKGSVLFVPTGKNEKLWKSSRNLPKTNIVNAASLNVEDLMKYKTIVLEQAGLPVIEKYYSAS